MMNFVRMAKAALKDQKGQGMVEYALILSAIAVAGITVYHQLGDKVVRIVQNVVNTLH